jgi:rhodanese-related sulfurtransferase
MKHLTIEGLLDFFRQHPSAKVLDVCSACEPEDRQPSGNVHLVSWYTSDWEPNSDFIKLVSQRISRDDYLLVICRSGSRSAEAGFLLEKSGFRHVYNLLGGHEELLKSPIPQRILTMARRDSADCHGYGYKE